MEEIIPNKRCSFGEPSKLNWSVFLKNRETGLKNRISHNDNLIHNLYSKLDTYKLPNEIKQPIATGVFNLEFSLDGHLLVAACENKSVQILDPFNHKTIHNIPAAHSNCVNCVKFLDDKTFATCSDDNTIKLWDIRKLSCQKRTLHAHSNWVKNIEYCEKDNVMVTSAFDGSIYSWDLSSTTGNSLASDKLFLMNGLMRTKLSPDSSQMIISTTSGYMIIIHDLNLKTLAEDLRSFHPMIYRLMQTSGQNFPAGSIYNYLFLSSRRRNRIEFIDDFNYEAEVISSLQIHPYGWNAVSRSMDEAETIEMTCVHDIQKRNESAFYYIEEDWNNIEEAEQNRHITDLWLGYLSNIQYERYMRDADVYGNSENSIELINSGLISNQNFLRYYQQTNDNKNKVIANLPRLTHFIRERNVGSGFIKELSYSRDGRIICSPFDKGVRILGFNKSYHELTYCVPDKPQQLVTLLEMPNYHNGVVVSCKFSPVSMELVSGCLNGEIVWYKPVL